MYRSAFAIVVAINLVQTAGVSAQPTAVPTIDPWSVAVSKSAVASGAALVAAASLDEIKAWSERRFPGASVEQFQFAGKSVVVVAGVVDCAGAPCSEIHVFSQVGAAAWKLLLTRAAVREPVKVTRSDGGLDFRVASGAQLLFLPKEGID